MSTAPALDVRPHVAAAKARIKAQFGPNEVYTYDEVPGTNGNSGDVPSIFAIVSVERRFAETPRMTGQPSRSGWRLDVRWAGRDEDEARWAESKVTAALEGVRLTISGFTSTRIRFETNDAPTYADGRMVGMTSFTYCL